METREKDLGCLWVKTSAKGEYMTGVIEIDGVKTNIVCFINGSKKEAKHPDWRILRSMPQNAPQAQNELPARDTEAIDPALDIPF